MRKAENDDLTLYDRGSQPGVHVVPGVYLPICRGTFEVSNIREKNSCIRFIFEYLHIYQNHMLIVKYIHE